MKKCWACGAERYTTDNLCLKCGNYVKFPKALLWLLIGLVIWPVLIYAFYLLAMDIIKYQAIKEGKYKPKSSEKIFNTFFLGNDSLRKKDGNVERGKCEIEFTNDTFLIKQNNEVIENPIDSIYYFSTWKYKDYFYFKIVMRSHQEYKFSQEVWENNKINKIIELLRLYEIEIHDDRKNANEDA